MYVYLLFDQSACDYGVDCIEEAVEAVFATPEQAIQSGLCALDGTKDDLYEITPNRLWFIGDEEDPTYVVKRYGVEGTPDNQVKIEEVEEKYVPICGGQGVEFL